MKSTRVPHLVVIGSSNTDLVLRCPRMPRPGETMLGGEFAQHAGGKGANQAVAAARAGAHVTFVGRHGDDHFGRAAKAGLKRERIDVRHFKKSADAPSGIALILLGGRSRENLIAVARSAIHHDAVRRLLAGADELHAIRLGPAMDRLVGNVGEVERAFLRAPRRSFGKFEIARQLAHRAERSGRLGGREVRVLPDATVADNSLSDFPCCGELGVSMSPPPFDASTTVRRILGGDIEAFREVIVAHERDVQGVVSALLESREGTRDLVQQTFVRVYQHLDRFDPARGEFRVWLRGIARHVVQGELRRRAREHARLGFYWEYLSSAQADAEAEAERAEALRLHVEACREKLEGDTARVLELRYDRGESMEAIARQLGRTLDNARKLLSRARLLVRECVERRLANS